MSAFFVPLGDGRYRATERTSGPWDPRHQHAGPPSALLTGRARADRAARRHGARARSRSRSSARCRSPSWRSRRRSSGRGGRSSCSRARCARTGGRCCAPAPGACSARPSGRRSSRAVALPGRGRAAAADRSARRSATRTRSSGAGRAGGWEERGPATVWTRHADPARRGRGADAAPARDGRRRLRQRRLERARLGPLPVHQHRARPCTSCASRWASGCCWTPQTQIAEGGAGLATLGAQRPVGTGCARGAGAARRAAMTRPSRAGTRRRRRGAPALVARGGALGLQPLDGCSATARSTAFISNSAKLAPRQRRTPPPNGIHV